MTQAVPLLFWTDGENKVERVKFSDLLLEFARPLTRTIRRSGSTHQEFSMALRLASLCWNAPLTDDEGAALDQLLAVIDGLEAPHQSAARGMLESRLNGRFDVKKYPFFLFGRIEAREDGTLTIHAYATYPDAVSASPEPETSVNERCPCGSGRKYKRCCRTRK
jgi:hypothetical protein